MKKYVFAGLLITHAFVHSLGFYHAVGIGNPQTSFSTISIAVGCLWLLAAILFMVVAMGYLTRKGWYMITIPAIVLSQALLITQWQTAKWATALNILAVLV